MLWGAARRWRRRRGDASWAATTKVRLCGGDGNGNREARWAQTPSLFAISTVAVCSGFSRIFGGFARVAAGRRGSVAWACGGSQVWVDSRSPQPSFFRFFFFLICQICCLIRCCRWVCEVALGGAGGFWSIPVVMGLWLLFLYCKNNNNNKNKIINKNKTTNYVENIC